MISTRTAPAIRPLDNFHATIEVARHNVPIMQKRILLEADVHERGFKAILQIAHFALEDAADEAFFGRALDVELFELAVFDDGDARFKRFGVDDDFLRDFLFLADEPLDPFHEIGRGEFDGFNDAFGLFRHGHGLVGFLFLDLGRGLQIGFAKLALFVVADRRRFGGHALGWQAGRDVFRALDFARGNAYISLPTDKNYTIEADVRGSKVGGDLPDMGVVANRYTLMLEGNNQKLRLVSWDALPRVDQTIPFDIQPDTWYRLKLTTAIEGDKGTIKGKAWPRDAKEPAEWLALHDPARFKLGTRMPKVPLTAKQLDEVVAYLERLK